MTRVLLTVLLSLLLLAPAWAATTRPMVAKPGVDELRRACSAAGGDFVIHEDGGGYGCQVENCDGKGGVCIIACDNNNNCHGSTPLVIQGSVTILGILQNGDMVYHERPSNSGPPQSAASSGNAGASTQLGGGSTTPSPVCCATIY